MFWEKIMPGGKTRYHRSVGKRPFSWNVSQYKQFQERKIFVQRDKKRIEKKVIGDKVPYVWEWKYGRKFGTVLGYCRSDARAVIKCALGISKKKPLPKEVQIKRVEFNEPTTSTES